MKRKIQNIKTKDLLLRPVDLGDAPQMFQGWAQDPEVIRYLTWPAHQSVADSLAILTKMVMDNQADGMNWSICELERPLVAIGTIGLVKRDEALAAGEIGYCLARRYWGRGYMTQALWGVIDFLMGEIGYNRLAARHNTDNPASGRVMQKAHMVHEGTLRQSARCNQGVCDMEWYAILRSEWAAVKMKEQSPV